MAGMDSLALDLECKTLIDMLARGQWLPHEVTGIERQIKDRKAQLEAGLARPSSSYWTRRLQELDPNLRLRWDFSAGWAIDRWVNEWNCWTPIGILGFHQIRLDLLDYLRERDMQRYGARAWLERKRQEAQAVRDGNDRRSTERVLSAVDRMTERRVREFINVERAIQTGDTIVARGETEKMLDRMTAASQRAQQAPEPMSIDSFTHPRVHKHKKAL